MLEKLATHTVAVDNEIIMSRCTLRYVTDKYNFSLDFIVSSAI